MDYWNRACGREKNVNIQHVLIDMVLKKGLFMMGKVRHTQTAITVLLAGIIRIPLRIGYASDCNLN